MKVIEQIRTWQRRKRSDFNTSDFNTSDFDLSNPNMSNQTTDSVGTVENFDHDVALQAWTNQAGLGLDLTEQAWEGVDLMQQQSWECSFDEADHTCALQELTVPLISPTPSPYDPNKYCSSSEMSMSASAPPVTPLPAATAEGPSKKRKRDDVEEGDGPYKKAMQNNPRRKASREQKMVQELVEAAGAELVQLQQAVESLKGRVQVLEQERASQEQVLTKVPEDLKDVPGFRRGWMTALLNLNWGQG